MPDTPVGGEVTPASSGHKRQRARNACLACRRRKRKCDTLYPCSMCTNYGYRCEYPKDESPVANLVDHPVTSPGRHASSVMNVRSLIASEVSPPSGRQEPRVVETGILDPFKSRYVNQNSAVAFPRALAADLQSATPLPLHSYGWNCGVRPEEKAGTHGELRNLITWEAFCQYSAVYFETVGPIFSFLDRDVFHSRAESYWSGATQQDLSQNSVIGAVLAVGSFFSHNNGHPRELDLVEWVKSILDDPQIWRVPSLDRVIAWTLRTVYLRATTRPHVSWLSSCLMLHLAEATGIHHEVQALRLTTDIPGQAPLTSDRSGAERARKVFWLAWSLNKMISYEYGRSAVQLSSITCKPVTHIPGEFTVPFIQLAQQLPRDGDPDTPTNRKAQLHEGLQNLKAIGDESEYICLTKGDIALCYYRRLRMLDYGIEREAVTSTIAFGRNAVAAAYRLAQQARPWWQVLGTVFQYICVLLAIDSAESLAEIRNAIETLEKIAAILNTDLATEALSTAKLLVRDSVRKKRRELEVLDFIGGTDGVEGLKIAGIENGEEAFPEITVNWDEFFDPTLSGSFWEIPDFGGAGIGGDFGHL